jgi:hypothetical protein
MSGGNGRHASRLPEISHEFIVVTLFSRRLEQRFDVLRRLPIPFVRVRQRGNIFCELARNM